MSQKLALLLLLLTWVAVTVSTAQQSDRLYQLRVLGCPVLARARRLQKARLQLSLDPLMCVTQTGAAASLTPRFDPVAKQTYVSVPVTLADNAARGNAALKLRRETDADSIEFATLMAITAATEPGSLFQALGFVWSQGEPVGFLRLGCNSTGPEAERTINSLVTSFHAGNYAALSRVTLSATLRQTGAADAEASTTVTLDFRVAVATPEPAAEVPQAQDYSVSSRRVGLEPCRQRRKRQLRPVRAVRIGNCSAMVYTAADTVGGHLLVEAPICFVGVDLGVGNDYSAGKPWLTLRLKVTAPREEEALSAARRQLADLEPKSVTFMLLWAAQRQVSRSVASRYDIGQLMMAADFSDETTIASSGFVRVNCHHVTSCRFLSSQIASHPVDFWRHVTWQPVYRLTSADGGHCAHSPVDSGRFSVRMADVPGVAAGRPGTPWEAATWREVCARGAPCKYDTHYGDGRQFVVVQQRSLGTVSFDRPWTEYVTGFGDENDFWIGLTALHLLSSHGATLRLEMRQWNDTEMVAEYAGFTVGDASTNYRMTYKKMVAARTNVGFDAMEAHKGMGFSTRDRDNDLDVGSCSLTWGRGGWWFNQCYKFYPNGLFPTTVTKDWKYLIWIKSNEVVPLRWVRMMLQI